MKNIEITPAMACKLCHMAQKATIHQEENSNLVDIAFELWMIISAIDKINGIEIFKDVIYKKKSVEKIYDERLHEFELHE